MTEIRTTLERIERRIDMPEPAMDRLLRRRERKQRKERIAAAVVGLGVAAAGIVGAVVTLRVAEGTRPASGGDAARAAADTGGFVLPTVAIWTAIVVLGLTVLAAVRLRARFADVDVEQEGRGPGGAAASARRPAAEPGTAPRGGGNEMDSKQKAEVTRIPGAQTPEIRFDDGKLRRTNRWLIGAVVVLAVALGAVGTWAIVDRSGEEGAAPMPTDAQEAQPTEIGRADPATVQTIDALFAATTGEEYAAFFTQDGVLDVDTDELVTLYGREDIAASMQGTLDQGWYAHRLGSVAGWDNFAAHAFAGPTEPSPLGKSDFHGMAIYEFTPDGQISRQWIFGNYRD